MKKFLTAGASLAAILVAVPAAQAAYTMQEDEAAMTQASLSWMSAEDVEAQMESNPLLAEWTGP